MADSKKKNVISKREMLARLQKNRDLERLEQIKYTGKLLEKESSLIKSQIHDLKKPPLRELSLISLPSSQSAVHLPPIKKQGLKEQKGFLKDIRGRNWKLYMSSREQVEVNKINQQHNDELKRKLFQERYKHHLQSVKLDCKSHWQKLEELQGKQGASIENSNLQKSQAFTERPAPKAAPQESTSKPVVESNPVKAPQQATVQATKKQPVDQEF